MNIIWFKFAICAGIIFFAGKRVARYADVIAEKTNLSRLWIGVILVAIATSLPELFTGVGSVVFVGSPDLAIGNILGANSYNLLNICLIDFLHRGGPILSAISSGQLLVAVSSLIPLMLATVAMALSGAGVSSWSVGNVGVFSIAIFVSYLILARVIYNYERKAQKRKNTRETQNTTQNTQYESISLKKACLYFAAAAAAIVASGIWLAYIGKELSFILHLNEGFVGSLFIGFVTTLPEITVSIAALFIGAKEIAVANMLGSNLFNLALIFLDDILYRKAPILQAVSPNHVWQGCVVMAMTAVVILAMATKPGKKFFNLSWYVPILFVIFLAGAYFSFIMGAR